MLDILSEPAWQGIGALLSLLALGAYLVLENRRRERRRLVLAGGSPRRKPRPKIEHIAVSDEASQQRFYEVLTNSIDRARESFYRSGHGFQSERQAPIFNRLLKAEADALARGVDITRIQTGAPVAASWARGYADLLRNHPTQLKVLADFESQPFNDVGLVDPLGHEPLVYLTFETREPGQMWGRTRPAVVVVIENDQALARVLASQFLSRVEALAPPLTAQEVQDLSETYVYFGWGVHMSSRKMREDVPGARVRGIAKLHDWERNVGNMVEGPALSATIMPQPGKSFDGVAYDLSWWGKRQLDRLEQRAYRSESVEIDVGGQRIPAFTYVPLSGTSVAPRPKGSWIEYVIAGAIENHMTTLLNELRAAGAPIDGSDEHRL